MAGDRKRTSLPRGCEGRETPLLLNPCDVEPEQYLEFTDEGVVRAAKGAPGPRMAETSIEVYGLNRTGLVLSREEAARLIRQRFFTIGKLATLLDGELARTGNLTARERRVRVVLEEILEHEIKALLEFTADERCYSLMARQMIDRFREKLTGKSAAALVEG